MSFFATKKRQIGSNLCTNLPRPLSEPSILKKKFDDIFSATKYSKALDEVKNIKKEMQQGLKLEVQKLEFLSLDCEKATKIKNTLSGISDKRETYSKQIKILDESICKYTASIDDVAVKAKHALSLEQSIEKKKNQLSVLEESRNDLISTLELLTESDEELQMMSSSQLNNTNNLELQIEKNRVEKSALLNEIKQIDQNISCYQGDIFKLESEINSQLDRIEKIKTQLGSYFATESNSVSVDEFKPSIEKMNLKLNLLDQDLSHLLAAYHQKEAELRAKKQQTQDRLGSLTELLASKTQEGANYQSQKNSVSHVLSQLQSYSQEIAEKLEFECQMELELLGKKQASFSRLNIDEKLLELNLEKNKIEMELNENQHTMRQLSKISETSARISIKKTELQRKENLLCLALNAVTSFAEENSIKLPDTWAVASHTTIEEFLSLFQSSVADLLIKKEHVAKQLDTATKNLDLVHIKLTSLNEQLDDFKSTLQLNKKRVDSMVREILSSESLETMTTAFMTPGTSEIPSLLLLVKKLEAMQLELNRKISSTTELESLYESFAQQIRLSSSCSLCERNFFSHAEKDLVLNKINKVVKEIPLSMTAYTAQLNEINGLLPKVRDTIPIYESSRLVEEEKIPNLMAQVESLVCTQSSHSSILGTLQEERARLEERELQFRKFISHIESALKISKEIRQIEQEVQFIERSNNTQGLSYFIEENHFEDVQDRVSSLLKKANKIREESDALGEERSARLAEIQKLELELKDKHSTLALLQSKLEDKKRLEDQLSELNKIATGLKIEITSIEDLINKENPDDGDIEGKSSALLAHFQQKEFLVKKERSELLATLTPLSLLIDEMNKWENGRGMKFVTSQISSLQEKILILKEKQKRKILQIDQLDSLYCIYSKQAAEFKNIERNVQDNIRERALSRGISARREELNFLLCEYSQGLSYGEYRRQEEGLKKEHSELIVQKAGIFGELKQVEAQLEKLAFELQEDYNEIERKHKSQFVKVKLTEMALADLDQYAKMLDSAIMKYHSLKMEEINKILRELWVSTYQSSDIDTIAIHSDAEVGKGNRSYNYRVVMSKGDTELDMRGRSSAGQRVLTSIIIRLALAETFGLSCGILALDEPTTNLDRASIESLAESLSNIIKSRRRQSNFQLIVITHDEEFVRLLGRTEFTDYYWRVSRDENQNSIIERQSITGA